MDFGGILNVMASGSAETFSSSLTSFETSKMENLFDMCKSYSLDNDKVITIIISNNQVGKLILITSMS